MNIFEALRASHDKQRELCKEIVLTRGNSESRRQLYASLKKELQAHAQAEDRYFYIPLMFDDIGLNISRHALSEHHEMDEIIEKIDTLGFSNPHWLVKVKELVHTVQHHLDEEEHGFFQQAGKILTAEQKSKLAQQYLNEYKHANKKIEELFKGVTG